jgi:ankyrin repeat protein
VSAVTESTAVSPTEERLFEAARGGDVATLTSILDDRPELLHARAEPYSMPLLHLAARHLPAIELLLARGMDVNVRDKGDNSYAMHWAAAGGELDVVRRLADAGGDVIGDGDDHQLGVIGWATCWDGCHDAAHRAVADFLISRGAKHHIFSAIALGLENEVRRIVANDAGALSRQMSRNENHQRPLHFAVRMRKPDMVRLLIALGADPLVTDDVGYTSAAYANDRVTYHALMDVLPAATAAELQRIEENGALHLAARRGDLDAVTRLLESGANPNALWTHWGMDAAPLHFAIWEGHMDVIRRLLDAGADPSIRDSMHHGDALGWAEHFHRDDVVALLRERHA